MTQGRCHIKILTVHPGAGASSRFRGGAWVCPDLAGLRLLMMISWAMLFPSMRLDAQAKIRGMVFLARLCTNALVWKCKAHKRKTPEDDLGGKRKGRFLKVCRVKTVGLIAQGTPTGKVWSCGLRRRIDPLPADRGLEKTGTPVISEPRLPSFGVWEIGPGAQRSVRRTEHLFIQIEVAGVAFGSMLNRSTRQTMWARHAAYPQPA